MSDHEPPPGLMARTDGMCDAGDKIVRQRDPGHRGGVVRRHDCGSDAPCEHCETRAEARIDNRDNYSRDRENDRADREAKWDK